VFVPAFSTRLRPVGPGAAAAQAASALELIRKAQEELKAHDSDGNKTADYWTRDVAGLHLLVPKGGGGPAKLLPLHVAAADELGGRHYPGVLETRPWFGYRFCIMTRNAAGALYLADPDRDGLRSTNLDGYAVCAYPSEWKPGVVTLIMREDGVIWAKDRGTGSTTEVSEYPKNPEAGGWVRWEQFAASR
jgi:hypothetical protein